MKAKEAKTKVCPFMSGHAGNAVDIVDCEKFCIAGDCMAWQHTDELSLVEDDKKAGSMSAPAEKETDTGYCMLLKGME